MSTGQGLSLDATLRTQLGRQAKSLLADGMLPAAVYRHGNESLHITVKADDFARVYKRAGTSRAVQLRVEDGPPMQVLVHRIERNPITTHLRHAVLLELRMTEKVTIEIPVRFVGEAPAVEAFDANILTQCERIRISALPGDLPTHVDADLGQIKTLQDSIHVGDLKLPATVAILNDPDEVVATAIPPVKRAETEETEETETPPTEPEVVGTQDRKK